MMVSIDDSPLRCLHVYSGNMYGGIETLLVTLHKNQNHCPAVQHQFALCFEGRLSRELTNSHAAVHHLPPVRFRYPWTLARSRRGFRELLDQHPFDVILFHSEWPLAAFGPVANDRGLPTVFWNHNFIDSLSWLHRKAKKVSPCLAISTSKATAATVPRLFPNVPTETVYCAVELPDVECDDRIRRAVRDELATPDDDVVIIQTSRMDPYKGHGLHLESLGRLKDVPAWTCWQVGGPQRPGQRRYFDELKRQARELGIADRVRFLGERSDVPRLLQAADIHCQPNVGPEPFGIAFIEALNARLPVVTTAIGGALEVVDERCGVLVPPGDPFLLAESLSKLIGDPQRRRQLAAEGPQRARRLCDPERQVQRLGELLQSLRHMPVRMSA